MDSEDLSDTEQAPNKFSCYLCDRCHFMRGCVRLKLPRKPSKNYDKKKRKNIKGSKSSVTGLPGRKSLGSSFSKRLFQKKYHGYKVKQKPNLNLILLLLREKRKHRTQRLSFVIYPEKS